VPLTVTCCHSYSYDLQKKKSELLSNSKAAIALIRDDTNKNNIAVDDDPKAVVQSKLSYGIGDGEVEF
jgi:hypothetical protein